MDLVVVLVLAVKHSDADHHSFSQLKTLHDILDVNHQEVGASPIISGFLLAKSVSSL